MKPMSVMFTPWSKAREITSAVGDMKKKVLEMLDGYERKHGKVKPCPVK